MVNYVMRIDWFNLPNFVRVAGPHQSETEKHMIDVGQMSDEQADEYWQGMQTVWMDHVRERRAVLGKSSSQTESQK